MRIIQRIAAVQLGAAMLALVVMGVVTAADVALKYLFSQPIAGAYDLVESLLPVVIFNGLPATLLRRQNILIDLVDHLAGPRRTRLLVTAADLVMLAMLGLIAWAMTGPALQALEYGDRKLELGLPIWAVWAGVLVGMAGSVLAALATALAGPPAPAGVQR